MQEQRNLNHQLSPRPATVIVHCYFGSFQLHGKKRAKTSSYSALNEAIQNAKQVSLQRNLILMSHPRMHLKKNKEKGSILNFSTDTAKKWLKRGWGGGISSRAGCGNVCCNICFAIRTSAQLIHNIRQGATSRAEQ